MRKEFNDSNFEQYIEENKFMVIVFYDSDMPLFDKLLGIFDQYAEKLQNKGNVLFCDVATMKVEKLLSFFTINALPGIVTMKGRRVLKSAAGNVPLITYENIIKDSMLMLIDEQK